MNPEKIEVYDSCGCVYKDLGLECPMRDCEVCFNAETQRDADGNLVKYRLTPIRKAILKQLGVKNMTRGTLWRRVNKKYPDVFDERETYGYLRGKRDLDIARVEILFMVAFGLRSTDYRCPLCPPDHQEPRFNAETEQVLRDSKEGKNLIRHENIEQMVKDLGI